MDGSKYDGYRTYKKTNERYISFIFSILFGLCFLSSVSIALFICITTSYICDEYSSQSFISSVSVIPGNARYLFVSIVILMFLLAVSYCVREIYRKKILSGLLLLLILFYLSGYWVF